MISDIRQQLQKIKTFSEEECARFYKTGAGEYAEHDRFLGISVPNLRKIAKQNDLLTWPNIQTLIESPFNEERLLALLILVNRFQKNKSEQHVIYNFYLKNIKQVNNWNLVDASAHWIMGAYLFLKNKTILTTLSKSSVLWERRIAIVATGYFIRQNELTPTIKISTLLLHDENDLIHKAVGWILREMGKRDMSRLIYFIEKHAHTMPRTMLRYAIEKFPLQKRQQYLKLK